MHPLLILGIGIVAVVVLIVVLRVNAFIALIGAALLVSFLAPGAMGDKAARVASAFGGVCGGIGIVIALAAVIGKCLMDSGAADRIVRSFLKLLGEKRAAWALMGSGFVLSIPVFFDTVFYLLVPLARSLWRRTGKHYLLYVSAIVAGAGIAHTLIPPTPGPLFMAAAFKIDVGLMILMGILVGLPTAAVGVLLCGLIDRWQDIPMRPYSGQTETEALDDDRLPPLWLALLPVLLPVVLIAANTVTQTLAKSAHQDLRDQGQVLEWAGVCGKLAAVGTDAESAPARLLYENLPAAGQQMLTEAARTGTCEPPLQDAVAEAVTRLVDEKRFVLEPAFLGVALPQSAVGLVDEAARALGPDEILRFNKHFRAQAAAGMITLGAGRPLLGLALRELTQEQQRSLNWLMLEAAFPGQVRQASSERVAQVTAFTGNPNLALFLSALVAMGTLVRSRKLSFKELAQTTETALMSGGVVILITAAGGAFGAMLRVAGIQKTIEQVVGSGQQSMGLAILLLAFGVAVLIKFAQGSGTVSMITTASMFAAMGLTSESLGCNPVYLAMSIGCGSLVGDWMNNSGFWIFARMSVLTERETLKSWTVLTALLGTTGLGFTLLFAKLLPFA
jgi:H+/gluconate symporter-like permease